jgi:hypothetical protein
LRAAAGIQSIVQLLALIPLYLALQYNPYLSGFPEFILLFIVICTVHAIAFFHQRKTLRKLPVKLSEAEFNLLMNRSEVSE